MNEIRFDESSLHQKPARGVQAWSFALGRDSRWSTFHFNGEFVDAREAALKEAARRGCTKVCLEEF